MEKKPIKIFIASSMVGEFKDQRENIDDAIRGLNRWYGNVEFQWNRPEEMSRAMSKEGAQRDYDAVIKDSELFFMIVERNLGEYTYHEFQVAWRRYFSEASPRIFIYFLLKGGEMPKKETSDFFWLLNHTFKHYPQTFSDWDEIKLEIIDELCSYAEKGLSGVPASGTANELKKRILENDDSVNLLIENGLTWEALPQVLKLYNENERLEDALPEEDAFTSAVPPLRKAGAFIPAVPPHLKRTMRKAQRDFALGACYAYQGDYGRAEMSYQNALKGFREAAERSPGMRYQNEGNVATVYNHLGQLLNRAGYAQKEEDYYWKALDIYGKLEKSNPAFFHADDGATGNVAMVYNNLATFYVKTGDMEGAERFFRESLKNFIELSKRNSDKYAPYAAKVCKNLGLFERERGNREEAKKCFEQALPLCVSLQLTEDAQICREELVQIQAELDAQNRPAQEMPPQT